MQFNKTEKKDSLINIRVSAEEKLKYQVLASRYELPLSDLVRQLLNNLITEGGK
ncbi:hypothetical protein JCM19232_1062 [Vibrio ishigakensis]|uniref:Uncharacterized protein n=1 Tax=Vibrio ishigakensis TaxID=1481914 RepID=A0A0B8PID6_9VIBR|nr:hypothetical protein JCM19232_1062 [Vibrio ishigakensis]